MLVFGFCVLCVVFGGLWWRGNFLFHLNQNFPQSQKPLARSPAGVCARALGETVGDAARKAKMEVGHPRHLGVRVDPLAAAAGSGSHQGGPRADPEKGALGIGRDAQT